MTNILVNSSGKAYLTSGNKALAGKNLGTKTITENGTYAAGSDSLDGYNSVTVSITELNGDTLNVTPSTSVQTITPTAPKNGFTQVNVNAVTSNIDSNISAENIKKDVQILGVTGSYEGSGGGAYQLHRVKDDSNNEIGTAFMEFEDANGNKYDVVCLDANKRLEKSVWCSQGYLAVTNLAQYVQLTTTNIYNAKETATSNTQKILDFCSAKGYTSSACTHCRSKSFTIGGTTYYGQLPNSEEILGIVKNYIQLESMDITASNYTSTNFSTNRYIWSSNQSTVSTVWSIYNYGQLYVLSKSTSNVLACPVLEIPNAL